MIQLSHLCVCGEVFVKGTSSAKPAQRRQRNASHALEGASRRNLSTKPMILESPMFLIHKKANKKTLTAKPGFRVLCADSFKQDAPRPEA